MTRRLALFLALLPLQAATINAIPGFSDFSYAGFHMGTYFGPLSDESPVMDGAIWIIEPNVPIFWFTAKDELMTAHLNSWVHPLQYFEAYRGGTFEFYVDTEYMETHPVPWVDLGDPPKPAETPEPWSIGMVATGLGLMAVGRRHA